MTADDAKKLAIEFVAKHPNYCWEYVDARCIDELTAGQILELSNKWIVQFRANGGGWNPAIKLVAVDDRSGVWDSRGGHPKKRMIADRRVQAWTKIGGRTH